jgi:hypothetical protein
MYQPKFKVWDPENKTLDFVGAIDWEAEDKPPVSCNTEKNKLYRYPPEELNLISYIGTEDIEGNEIYENFYLLIPSVNIAGTGCFVPDMIGLVRWHSTGFCLLHKSKKDIDIPNTYWEDCKIVGNIYQGLPEKYAKILEAQDA